MSSHIDISGSGSSGNSIGSALPASILGSINIIGSALPASKLGSFESQTATQRCQSTVQPGETAHSHIDIISGSGDCKLGSALSASKLASLDDLSASKLAFLDELPSGSALPASNLAFLDELPTGSALPASNLAFLDELPSGSALPASNLSSGSPWMIGSSKAQSTVQPGETAHSHIDSGSGSGSILPGSALSASTLGSSESQTATQRCQSTVQATGIKLRYLGETARCIKLLGINNPEEDTYNDGRLRSVVSIFKVPKFLKESKQEQAYVPKIVPLGPYHSKRAELCPMDTHKRRALRRMMTRFNIRHRKGPDSFAFSAFEKIFQDDEKIRESYEEKISRDSEDLAALLTLDGCFILEILRTLGNDPLISQDPNLYEPVFESRKIDLTGFDILNDILKLENQIPIIVLRHLVELELKSVDNANKFLFDVLVKTPGIKFYPFDYKDDMGKWSWAPPGEQIHHYLGLLHSLIVSPPFDNGDERAVQIDTCNCKRKSAGNIKCIPPAVELSNKAGIKFKRHGGGIKQIKFDRNSATVYLPPINITDHTEVLFRNLIALELCKPSEVNYVSCYLNLMNKLIDTEKDVAVLKESKVIANHVGSDAEVADLFNGLCTGVTPTPKNPFEELEEQVIELYGSKSKAWLVEFKNDYLSSPWKILALAGAIVALVLTLLQTIYSAH